MTRVSGRRPVAHLRRPAVSTSAASGGVSPWTHVRLNASRIVDRLGLRSITHPVAFRPERGVDKDPGGHTRSFNSTVEDRFCSKRRPRS